MRARGGEEESGEESGDSKEDWLACKVASTCPNEKDLSRTQELLTKICTICVEIRNIKKKQPKTIY